MTKEQAIGQLREVLTAAGAVLATWGISDGNGWAPAIGAVLALASLLWGVAWHRDKGKPGKVRWTLVRKFVNALGAAAVTYGVLNPDKVQSVDTLLAAIGPVVASATSWISNGGDGTSSGSPLLLVVALMPFFALAGCETMAIRGSVGYIDPNTGTKAGMTYEPGSHSAGWYVKVPWSGKDKDSASGALVLEGDIPVEQESGK